MVRSILVVYGSVATSAWRLLGLLCALAPIACAAGSGGDTPEATTTTDGATTDTPTLEAGTIADSGSGRSDATVGADTGTSTDSASAFPPTEGTSADADRTSPCAVSEEGTFRAAPEDGSLAQACLPAYDVWAPVVCGGPRPPCTCAADKCALGEVAKLVSGTFCVCLTACKAQSTGATCAAGKRRCIPVDDVTKSQVFICGGST